MASDNTRNYLIGKRYEMAQILKYFERQQREPVSGNSIAEWARRMGEGGLVSAARTCLTYS